MIRRVLRGVAGATGVVLLAAAAFLAYVALRLAFTGAPLPNESLLGVLVFGAGALVLAAAGAALLWLARRRL